MIRQFFYIIKYSLYLFFFILQENLGFFLVDLIFNIWKIYVSYIDDMLLDGFFFVIECFFKYFLENIGIYQFMDVGYYWKDYSNSIC